MGYLSQNIQACNAIRSLCRVYYFSTSGNLCPNKTYFKFSVPLKASLRGYCWVPLRLTMEFRLSWVLSITSTGTLQIGPEQLKPVTSRVYCQETFLSNKIWNHLESNFFWSVLNIKKLLVFLDYWEADHGIGLHRCSKSYSRYQT